MNTDRFSGKSILITGGAGGLGSQIARSVIAQGGSVGILDTNDGAIKSLVSELKAIIELRAFKTIFGRS